MAKSENQKSKLLHLANILLTETDEEHGLTTNELIEKLAALEIKAERKSIYSDIETLQDFGLDIIQNKAKRTTYFVGSRDFELGELKLLVDAITASRFIP
ncbi:MAG: WYL domain-containing protein, partial [Oscillospiraceae bacterium]|nr:WYL domain-containing protein [Oscillospiraceae bacterium]